MVTDDDRSLKKTGSRPFSPIYDSFQSLLEFNQGVFRLFRKAKNPGMYQAVWQARQGEIDTYKTRLSVSEKEILDQRERIEDLKSILRNKNKNLEKIEEELKNLQYEITQWKAKALQYKEDKEKEAILRRSLERVSTMKDCEVEKIQGDLKKTETHLQLSNQALIKLDEEYEKQKFTVEELKKQNYELNEKLEKSSAYTKEYRRINHRMENELFRLANENEKLTDQLSKWHH